MWTSEVQYRDLLELSRQADETILASGTDNFSTPFSTLFSDPRDVDAILTAEESNALELVKFHPFYSAQSVIHEYEGHSIQLDCTIPPELRWYKDKRGELFWILFRKITTKSLEEKTFSSLRDNEYSNAPVNTLMLVSYNSSLTDMSHYQNYILTSQNKFRSKDDVKEELQVIKANPILCSLWGAVGIHYNEPNKEIDTHNERHWLFDTYRITNKCSYWDRLRRPVHVLQRMATSLDARRLEAAHRLYAPKGAEYEKIKTRFETMMSKNTAKREREVDPGDDTAFKVGRSQ